MRQKGFTLIELLVTLTVICILLLIGIPAYQNLITRNKADAVANSLVVGLELARSEAIALGVPVKFCASSDQKTCGDIWEAGQIVIDSAGIKVMRVFPALAAGDKLLWDSSIADSSDVEFSPLGTTTGQQGSFYYCPAGNDKLAKAIIVSYSGRVRISDKKSNGTTIDCS